MAKSSVAYINSDVCTEAAATANRSCTQSGSGALSSRARSQSALAGIAGRGCGRCTGGEQERLLNTQGAKLRHRNRDDRESIRKKWF